MLLEIFRAQQSNGCDTIKLQAVLILFDGLWRKPAGPLPRKHHDCYLQSSLQKIITLSENSELDVQHGLWDAIGN